MIRQRMAEQSAGCCKGVVESIVRIVHLIDLEHRFQTAFIEAGIMCHKGNGSYLIAEIIDCLLVCEALDPRSLATIGTQEYISYPFF